MLKYARKILLFYVLLLFGAPLTAQENLVISVMANTGVTEPASTILRQAYQHVGIDIQIQRTPGKRGLFNANSGKTDGDAYRVKGLESSYENLIRIDVPVREEHMYFYVKKGKEFSVQDWDSFPSNYMLGYIRGTYFIEKAAAEQQIKVQPSSNYNNLLKQLNANRNDAIIMSEHGQHLIDELNLSNEIIRLEPPAHSFYLYHYLHKRNRRLIPMITESLQKMYESGEIQTINNLH